jgi:hypothetical protein
MSTIGIYEKHLSDCWCESVAAAETLGIAGHLKQAVILEIFKKSVSPKHYFFQNAAEKKDDQPTKRQIELAAKLNIKNPTSYTKKELSAKIAEVFANE